MVVVESLGMNECEFYRVVLGLEEPWEVTGVAVDADRQNVEVTVACKAGTLWACPESRERLPAVNNLFLCKPAQRAQEYKG